MNNWLVLVHDVYTGSVVRQFVTTAADSVEAVSKFAHLINEGTEHGIAIPTGSEPEPDPTPAPADNGQTAAASDGATDQKAQDALSVTPEVVPVAAEPAAEDEAAQLIADELKSLPEHVLARVKAFLAGI